nr:hypothetical protein KitaXyl93_54580 [Kitasatospora sp. Xyl93]
MGQAKKRKERGEYPTQNSVIIRAARPGEEEEFAGVLALIDPEHRESALATWPSRDTTAAGVISYIGAYDKGRPVGAIRCAPPWFWIKEQLQDLALQRDAATRFAHVEGIAVVPDRRGEGIGRRLLAAAEKLYRSKGYRFLALEHEPALTGFYASCGFQSDKALVCATPRYYVAVPPEREENLVAFKSLQEGISYVPSRDEDAVKTAIEEMKRDPK